MACDNVAPAIHQDHYVKAELRDTGSDLRNLRIGVRTRVVDVGDESIDRPVLNALGPGLKAM